jgi:hypothetical protein
MMRNDFICELDLSLDLKTLSDIAFSSREINGMPSHHRLARDNIVTDELQKKYKFLSPVFNVYKFTPGRILQTHIDADRFCAINIPICNTESSDTIFYNKDDSAQLEYDPIRIVNTVTSQVKECFRFTLHTPTLINTTYPHSVINYGNDTRVIISWSVLRPITFQQCVDLMTML